MSAHGDPLQDRKEPDRRADLRRGIRSAPLAEDVRLAWFLAVNDLRHRYARSFIGPLWIVLQMAVFVGILGGVLSQVHGVPIAGFLPFFAVSLLFWSFLSTSLNEGMECLRDGADLIKDRGIRPIVPILQTILRNLLIALHCLPIPVAALVWFAGSSLRGLAMALPGMVAFVVVVALLTVCISGLAVRFRDLKRIVETLLMIAFVVTPILWQPGVLRERASYVLDLNPFAHLFAIWRDPLLEGRWPAGSALVCAALIAGLLLCARLAVRRLGRAAFWL